MGRRDPLTAIAAAASLVVGGAACAEPPNASPVEPTIGRSAPTAADRSLAASRLELPAVDITGVAPLPGSGESLRDLPANVQVFEGDEVRRSPATTLADFLERRAGGVTLGAVQGNRYQPDLSFRGFTASPVLGTPQGVSVFIDGVRINEPFGDTVNWDLIPMSAIARVEVVPGSNAVFGLNTLGGAIAIQTRSGASDFASKPGLDVSTSVGSHARRELVADAAGQRGRWDFFATAKDAIDPGWALHDRSRVQQFFSKLGWRDARSDVALTVGAATSRLEGVQAVPASFGDARQPYTWPDIDTHRAASLQLSAGQALGDAWRLRADGYLRRFALRNISSNVDDGFATGGPEASNDASSIDQTSAGLHLQLLNLDADTNRRHRWTFGAGVDRGQARFRRRSQPAAFSLDRATIGIGDFESDTDAGSTTRHFDAYAIDAWRLDPRWTLTVAGRLDRAEVSVADRSGTAPELDGRHRYTRLDPSIGATYRASERLTAYAGYNEGMRAPTAVELTCADPSAPCKLPNDFIADPALKAVVSKTVELGARGRLGAATRWNAALYRTDLHDDIQFIASGGLALQAGHFENVGTTRRQGLQLSASTALGERVTASAHYDWIDATYRTGYLGISPANSSADANGAIAVRRGDRMPGIPRQQLKLRVAAESGERWSAGASWVAASSIRARGDENNQDANGRIGGWARLDLDGQARVAKNVEVHARIDNALDRRYASFAILGSNVFTGTGRTFDGAHPRNEPFLGYGAPRSVSIGIDVHWE